MQKKKSGVKKCLEILPLKGGGVGRLMANAILNFHFDFLHTSLTCICTIPLSGRALWHVIGCSSSSQAAPEDREFPKQEQDT